MSQLPGWIAGVLLSVALILSGCASAGEGAGGEPTLSPTELKGKQVFSEYCARCHSTSPEVEIVGPSLAGIAETAPTRTVNQDAEAYLRSSIMEPGSYVVDGYQDLMPESLHKAMTEEQIDALIAYLMTLN